MLSSLYLTSLYLRSKLSIFAGWFRYGLNFSGVHGSQNWLLDGFFANILRDPSPIALKKVVHLFYKNGENSSRISIETSEGNEPEILLKYLSNQ